MMLFKHRPVEARLRLLTKRKVVSNQVYILFAILVLSIALVAIGYHFHTFRESYFSAGLTAFLVLISVIALYLWYRQGGRLPKLKSSVLLPKSESRYKLAPEEWTADKQAPKQSYALLTMHKRFGRRSREVAIILFLSSFVMLMVSYFFSNLILQIDSPIAFLAGVVILFREQKHSVQLRIVNRLLSSSREFAASLANGKLDQIDYSYVPLGSQISDVALIPSSEFTRVKALSEDDQLKTTLKSEFLGQQLVPSGRGLAELFSREVPVSSMDEFVTALPIVIVDRFQLAASVKVNRQGNSFHVNLARPALAYSCASVQESIQKSLTGCGLCSMIATLVCHFGRGETRLYGCEYDKSKDSTTIKLELAEPLDHPQEQPEKLTSASQ